MSGGGARGGKRAGAAAAAVECRAQRSAGLCGALEVPAGGQAGRQVAGPEAEARTGRLAAAPGPWRGCQRPPGLREPRAARRSPRATGPGPHQVAPRGWGGPGAVCWWWGAVGDVESAGGEWWRRRRRRAQMAAAPHGERSVHMQTRGSPLLVCGSASDAAEPQSGCTVGRLLALLQLALTRRKQASGPVGAAGIRIATPYTLCLPVVPNHECLPLWCMLQGKSNHAARLQARCPRCAEGRACLGCRCRRRLGRDAKPGVAAMGWVPSQAACCRALKGALFFAITYNSSESCKSAVEGEGRVVRWAARTWRLAASRSQPTPPQVAGHAGNKLWHASAGPGKATHRARAPWPPNCRQKRAGVSRCERSVPPLAGGTRQCPAPAGASSLTTLSLHALLHGYITS